MSDHEAYSSVYQQSMSWCENMAVKLDVCCNSDESVESKLNQLNDLLTQCSDEGTGCVQTVRDAVANVLTNTSTSGGSAINNALSELVTYFRTLVDKISSARDEMEATLASSNKFDASSEKLLEQLCDAEDECNGLTVLQSTLAQKMLHAERSKVCFVLYAQNFYCCLR